MRTFEDSVSEYQRLQEKAQSIYDAGKELKPGEEVKIEIGSVPPSQEPTIDGLVRKLDNSPNADGTYLSLAFDQESQSVSIMRMKRAV